MIDSVKSGRQIQQNEVKETWLKTTRSSVLAMNGRREIGL